MEKALKRKFRLKSGHWFCILALTPILIPYGFIRFIPIVQTMYISFFQWDLISANKPFVGLDNYKALWTSSTFIQSITNTTLVAFGILIFSVPLGIVIAAVLDRGVRFKSWFESLYFLPYIMPMVPAAVAWRWILDSDHGVLNYFLSFFGVGPKAWLIDPKLAVISVVILSVWKMTGYNMIILLVGMKGISKEHYEAAAIDGATGIKSFWHITIPLLKPITVFVSTVTLIQGYNVFSQVYIMASDIQGAPGHLVRVLVYDMIENGFRFYKMGYASAESVVLFLIVMVLTFLQLRLLRDKETSGKGMRR